MSGAYLAIVPAFSDFSQNAIVVFAHLLLPSLYEGIIINCDGLVDGWKLFLNSA